MRQYSVNDYNYDVYNDQEIKEELEEKLEEKLLISEFDNSAKLICPECNNKMDEEAEFCTICGWELELEEDQEQY